MFFQLIRNNCAGIIGIITGYLIPLTGYAQSNTFVIDNDEKSIISINQIIAETEVVALENTEIEIIKAEAIAAKQSQQAAEQTAANDSSQFKFINY
jgi:uncharacterized small protein (DUF1192 family)